MDAGATVVMGRETEVFSATLHEGCERRGAAMDADD